MYRTAPSDDEPEPLEPLPLRSPVPWIVLAVLASVGVVLGWWSWQEREYAPEELRLLSVHALTPKPARRPFPYPPPPRDDAPPASPGSDPAAAPGRSAEPPGQRRARLSGS